MTNTTVRSGWNTRGGTLREHARIAVLHQERLKEMAETKLLELCNLVGERAYQTWCDLNIQDGQDDWSTIRAKAQSTLEALPETECRDNGVNTCSCASCRPATANQFFIDDAPYWVMGD